MNPFTQPPNLQPAPLMPRVQTCSRGTASVTWNTHTNGVAVTVPDTTCLLKVEMLTLTGLTQFELSRFDKISRQVNWDDNRYIPTDSQKFSLFKYIKALENKYDPRIIRV